MSLVRYQGWPQMTRLHTELNRLFDAPSGSDGWRPPVDIQELDDKFVIAVDLPGVEPTEIDLTVEKNVLSISGTRSIEKDTDQDGYHRFERTSGGFSRRFSLPDNVDGEHVSANGQNGVLTVSVPKMAAAQPRKISVAAA